MSFETKALTTVCLGLLIVIIGVFSFLSVVDAAFDRREWTRHREIKIPDQNVPQSYVLVDLDAKLLAASQPDLADLRVSDDRGEEIPSKLIASTERRGLENRQVEMLDLVRDAGGVSRFTLDLGESPERHNRLEINTASQNFSRQVRIEISDDNRRWAEARNDGYIFDFSRDTAARYLEITYPVSTKRYLRASILNGRESPIAIDGATVQFSSDQEEILKDWPANIIARSVDEKPRASVLLIDIGYEKLPTSRIEFQTTATNFHRQVEIEGSNQAVDPRGPDRRRWSSIGSGQIFSIQLDRVDRKQLDLSYPESRYRFLRVHILDYDDRPLEIAGVKISGRTQRLLFRREPGKSYELYYGNAAAVAPRYDLAQLSSYLDLGRLQILGLGEEQSSPPPPKPAEPWLEKRPMWLWATLAVAALLLGGLIFRLAKMTSEQ